MATIRSILSSTALASTALASGLGLAAPALAQDAYPVSGDQFGYGSRAVAEANFQASLFGGGDDNGGTYGGAPSFAMPLGDKLGLQVDGIGGVTADEVGFFGGAAQLFYRDPSLMTLGIAGGGYYLEGNAQYAVSAIAEYYYGKLTLEGTVGYLTGDVIDGSVYGRLGAAIYATPNFRLGAGVTYSDETRLGGDVQLEALIDSLPGVALFATGSYDDDGAAGFGGLRFYLNSATTLISADRTKQASDVTLMGMHRNLTRPNFFLSDPTGFGLRQISRAAGAAAGGKPFGEIDGGPGDGGGPQTCPGGDADPATPGCQAGPGNTGLVDVVNDVVSQVGDGTALQPLTDLLNALTSANGGPLSAITGPLNQLTQLNGGALGPLTELVQGLAGTNNSALTPLINALNGIIGGLGAGADPAAVAGGLSNLPGADALAGLLGGSLPGGSGTGLIDLVNGVLGDLGDNSAVQPLTDLLNALTNPDDGTLSPLTSALNDLTTVDGGPLGPLTQLVGGLAGADNAALNPLISALNGILGGFAAGADPAGIAAGLGNLPGASSLDGLLGGVLPGGSGVGLVNLVNNLLGDLGDDTAVQPLTDLLNALTNPVSGGLSPLTGALNGLTSVDGGPLAPLTELVGSLAGTDNAALNPLVSTLNGILGGFAAGADPADIAAGLSNLPGASSLTGLFGGLLPGGSSTAGLIDTVNGVLNGLGQDTALQPLTDLLTTLTSTDQTAALGALITPINDLTALDGGGLAPLTALVNGLIGANDGALSPLVEALNGILGGLTAGQDPTAVVDTVTAQPGLGQLAGLLGF